MSNWAETGPVSLSGDSAASTLPSPVPTSPVAAPADHIIQFYDRDEELFRLGGDYLAGALLAGEAAVLAATEPHRIALEAVIAASGVDVRAAQADGLLITADANETFARISVNGMPDAGRFDAVVGGLVRSAARMRRPVRAYGEMVGLLCDNGNLTAALELEDLWSDLRQDLEFSLLCPCHVGPGSHPGASRELGQRHSAVVRDYPGTAEAPSAARHFLVDTFKSWGWGDHADDAAVVVTELATNAVIHASSDFTVSVSEHDETVRVTVGDASGVPPLRRSPSELASSGRGMNLLGALTHDWGVELFDDGKVVWAEFHR